jgi:hypothetical protein
MSDYYRIMLEDAIRSLAAIDEALGIGEDGCSDLEQTLYAIGQLDIQHEVREEIEELRAYIEGKKWVGLTDDERMALFETAGGLNDYAKAIEAKLKDKNV